MGDDNWTHLPKLIAPEIVDAICHSVKQLADAGHVFSIVLHGGEPLLLGLDRLSNMFMCLRRILPHNYPISLQTNGILISNEILDICSQYFVTIAVSIDGPEQVQNRFRIDHKNRGTFDNVLAGIECLKAHPNAKFLNSGVLAVIDPTTNPEEIYNFFKSLDVPSVDFLYKDGNHDILPIGKANIDSTEYGQWLVRLLQIYFDDPTPLPIRIIDDMFKALLSKGNIERHGSESTPGILIIDTDGVIMKNDTLKSAHNGADKFDNQRNIKDTNLLEFLASAEYLDYQQMQKPTSPICMQCPYLSVCGGGMILHRWKSGAGFDNVSIYCADQRLVIDKMQMLLEKSIVHEAN